MNSKAVAVVLCALVAGAALPVAGSPVYKWVDESGVVNYSSDPPPGRRTKATIIDFASTKVSSYDPVSAGLDPNSQTSRNNQYLRMRVDQLQRQMDGLDYARQVAAETAEQAGQRALEQCQLQRRVDCGNDYEDIGYPRVALISRHALLPGRSMVHARAVKSTQHDRHGVRHPGGTRRLP